MAGIPGTYFANIKHLNCEYDGYRTLIVGNGNEYDLAKLCTYKRTEAKIYSKRQTAGIVVHTRRLFIKGKDEAQIWIKILKSSGSDIPRVNDVMEEAELHASHHVLLIRQDRAKGDMRKDWH